MEPGKVYDENDQQPVTGPDLRRREGLSTNRAGHSSGGATDSTSASPGGATDSTKSGSTPTPQAHASSDKLVPRQSLKNRESSPGGGQSFYKEPGPEDDSPGRLRRLKGGFRKLAKHKLLTGGVLGGSGLIAIIIVILIIIAGAYKIVDFAEHVAAYQFARETGQMAEDATNITDEEVAIASVSDSGIYNALKAKYDTAAGNISELWSKLDKYQPGKVISNFQNNGIMTFNNSQTSLGRTYTSSVTINNEKANIINSETSLNNSFAANHIPGFKFANDFQFSRDFAPDLIKALRAEDIGPITRGRFASQIRQELNIGLTAWITGRFAGKSQAAADAELERQSVAAAEGQQLTLFDDPSGATAPVKTATGASPAIDQAATDTQSELNKSLTNNAQSIADNPNQTPQAVANALAKDVSSANIIGLQGFIGKFIGFINPVYKFAVPLCLIYDGSLKSSGSTIDEQSNQLQRSGVWAQSAAAQEKDGYNATGEAVGATDWKLGDITQSNAEKRASGLPVNTSTTLSTEASPTGQYTYSVADYLGGIGSVVDSLSPGVCKAVTNLYVGIGLGVVNLGLTAILNLFPTGAPVDAAEAGGEAALQSALEEQLSLFDASTLSTDAAATDSTSFLSNIVGKAGNAGSYAKNFAKDTAKQVIAIGALTVLAQQLVAAEMGGSHSPTATGPAFDNGVDAGTNIYANQNEQRQFYGAPMTDQALGPDNSANEAQLASKVSSQSLFQRYASVSNPDSLINHLAMDVAGHANGSIFDTFLHTVGAILTPFKSLGSLFASLTSRSAYAQTSVSSANTYYGNVQFGYQAEKALLDSCPTDSHDPKLCSYQPLENQLILDQSGNETAITTKYGKCFDGSQSIGTMLANGDIQRDKNGNVLANANGELCSPDNLGLNSPDTALSTDTDPTSPNDRDMIFRWRLAHNYNNSLDQLACEQDTTTSCSQTTASN